MVGSAPWGRLMGTYEAEQLLPGVSLDYFLSAKQQLKVVLQWVGVKRGDKAYRILIRGDLLAIRRVTQA